MSVTPFPREVFANLVAQRRIRAAARELRAAHKVAPTDLKDTLREALDVLAALDERIDSALDLGGTERTDADAATDDEGDE